jgi:hypothetical protein
VRTEDSVRYYEALRDIEALWDAILSDQEVDRLGELIRAAEEYEAEQQSPNIPAPDQSAPNVRGSQIDVEMVKALSEPVTYQAFVRWRSAIVAIRACSMLFGGNAAATAIWMNRQIHGIGQTPIDLAENDDGGLQMALDHIGRIDAGIFH